MAEEALNVVFMDFTPFSISLSLESMLLMSDLISVISRLMYSTSDSKRATLDCMSSPPPLPLPYLKVCTLNSSLATGWLLLRYAEFAISDFPFF